MSIIQSNTHPIFEADQVLTSDHLNDMFNYLEEQERLSRAKLVGSGIVCGLDLNLESSGSTSTVVISKGVGLTSKGYMIAMDVQEGEESISYPYYTTYVRPIDEDPYAFFLNGSTEMTIYELQSQSVEGAKPITDLTLTNYGVLLYLECKDKQLKNCIENDCNEKGIERIFTLRKLLVEKPDIRNIICQEEELDVPKNESEIGDHVNARFRLAPIKLPRFTTKGVDVVTSEQFKKIYRDLIVASASKVYEKLEEQMAFLEPLLKHTVDINTPFEIIFNLQPSDYGASTDNIPTCDLQYRYDYLCDIADAYNELADAVFDLMTRCCPPLDRHPKHLRLGDLTTTFSIEPSAYRSGFLNSPIHNQQQELKDRVIVLSKRLLAVVVSIQSTESFDTVKVTPSVALDRSLSDKSIPYYYNVNEVFARNWNPRCQQRRAADQNLSYHAANYSSQDHVVNPLEYGLSAYDFFRVEGHICKNYQVALTEIIAQRDYYNLPFDVIALKIGRDASGTDFDDLSCNFRDLQTMCDAWKTELGCLLEKVLFGLSVAIVSLAIKNATSMARRSRAVTTESPAEVGGASSSSTSGSTGDTISVGGSDEQSGFFERMQASLNLDEGSIGSYVVDVMQTEEDICKVDGQVEDAIVADEEAAGTLPQQDFQVAYRYPVQLITALLEFAKLLDEDCATVDLNKLDKAIKSLNLVAGIYLLALYAYQKRTESEVEIDDAGMISLVLLITGNCNFDALVQIRAEMDKRKEEILKMNLFHEYLKKNPGIDHKAGVPKGGTLVMVYAGDDAKGVVGNSSNGVKSNFVIEGTVVNSGGEAMESVLAQETGTTNETSTDSDGNFRVVIPTGPSSVRFVFAGYQTMELEVHEGDSDLIITLSQNDTEGIDAGSVIADFYLPYLCCSDCPPMTYVLPSTESGVDPGNEGGGDPGGGDEPDPTLSLTPLSFCLPDTGFYEFDVTPEGAVVTGPGVSGNPTDGYIFTPGEVDMGGEITKELEFVIEGSSVSITRPIAIKPSVAFTGAFEWSAPTEEIETSLSLDLNITNFDDRVSYNWKAIKIGSTVTELFNGPHTSSASSQSFNPTTLAGGEEIRIVLGAENGDCTDELPIVLTVPEKPILGGGPEPDYSLDLTPTFFCIPDSGGPYVFEVNPPTAIVTGVGVTGNATDGFRFNPDSVPLGGNVKTEVELSIEGTAVSITRTVEVTPSPAFTGSFVWRSEIDGGEPKLHLDLSITEFDSRFTYQWGANILGSSSGPILSQSHTESTADISFTPAGLTSGEQVKVALIATNENCNDNDSVILTVPAQPSSVDFEMTIKENGKTVVPPPYRFSSTKDSKFFFNPSLPGSFEQNTALTALGIKKDTESGLNCFSPFGKQAKVYQLKYNYSGGSETIQIEVVRGDLKKEIPTIGGLENALKNEELVKTLGAESTMLKDTGELLKVVNDGIEDSDKSFKLTNGEYNSELLLKMKDLSVDTSKMIIGKHNPERVNNSKEQNLLLDFYRGQLSLALELTAVQNKDLTNKDPLSKMMTQYKIQLKRMIKAGVKVDVGKKTQKVIKSGIAKVGSKPKVTSRFQSVLSVLSN